MREAWRAYTIGGTGRLRPVGYKDLMQDQSFMPSPPDELALTFEIGQVVEAHCLNKIAHLGLRTVSVRDQHPDMESFGECACGFYTRETRDELVEYLLTHLRPYHMIGLAIGPVMPEGWVAQHKKGQRAEKMRVLPPELVLYQTLPENRVYEPLSHGLAFHPVHAERRGSIDTVVNWKETRVATWAEWKKEIEPWILERSKRSSRLFQNELRYLSQRGSPSLHSWGGAIHNGVMHVPIPVDLSRLKTEFRLAGQSMTDFTTKIEMTEEAKERLRKWFPPITDA